MKFFGQEILLMIYMKHLIIIKQILNLKYFVRQLLNGKKQVQIQKILKLKN